MGYSAVDIANYFISLYKFDEEHPTNLKLNKLVYYAQGHSLARFGRVLFDEEIEAWDYGPVVPSVYSEFRRYKKKGIDRPTKVSQPISDDDEELLLDVARYYGKFTGPVLADMTHVEGSPWDKVYVEGEQHIQIPIDIIEKYFKETETKLKTIDEEIGALPIKEWADVI